MPLTRGLRGTHAVTGSGDSTVKVWSFATASCSVTLRDHTQAVWSVAFHDEGDFVASASMDHTSKLWDIVTYDPKAILGSEQSLMLCIIAENVDRLFVGT